MSDSTMTRTGAGAVSRRGFLGIAAGAGAAGAMAAPLAWGRAGEPPADRPGVPERFPAQDDESVRSVVGASHGNMERVRELVEARPALARASWDWGFGDWETALGAASHVGNREIAEFLMSHGARPDLFTCAMMGWVDALRAAVSASPGLARVRGPHGLTLMHHARAGREHARVVAEYLESVEGADEPYPEAAMGESDRALYVGSYAYAPGAGLEITDDRGSLWLAPTGGAARRLVALGGHAFHPVGAEAVRVVFAVEGGRAVSLTVHDPGPVVVAARG